MVARKSYIGPEVDIWSLGVLLFVMITAQMPFGESNMSKLFLSIMTAKFTIPSSVSQSASSLIKAILVPKIEKRATLEDIRNHPWMSGKESSLPLLDFSSSRKDIPKIRSSVRQQLLQMGFEQSELDLYEYQGIPGPVKSCAFLLEQLNAPRKRKDLDQELGLDKCDPKAVSSPVKVSSVYQISSPITVTLPHSVLNEVKRNRTSIVQEKRLSVPAKEHECTKYEGIPSSQPPVIATFLHDTPREKAHTIILEALIGKGGKITHFDDALEQANSMLFAIPIHYQILPSLFERSPLDDKMDVDDEVLLCFMESKEEWIEIKATTIALGQAKVNHMQFHTIFHIMNPGELTKEALDSFDECCMELIRKVS